MADDEDPPEEEWSPFLPYAGSSGWSGSDTSKGRADHNDNTGVTARRQRQALVLLGEAGVRGLTWKEYDRISGLEHHGSTSGVLSNMHKAGRIARLAETRQHRHVYVLPQNVGGRETQPFGGKVKPTLAEAWRAGWQAGYDDYDQGTETPNPYDR